MLTYAYGYPRIGVKREFKKYIEGYWKGKYSEDEMRNAIETLEKETLETYATSVDEFPVAEMTYYDNMLDTALMVGLVSAENMAEYFELCRGKGALEMTKWFNTNYHYLVPEIPEEPSYHLAWNKPKERFDKYGIGIPYLIGPFTFLKLSKGPGIKNFKEHLTALTEVYAEIISGFEKVHIDEPAFVMELSDDEVSMIRDVYRKLGSLSDVYLMTYYESVDFLQDLYDLPLKAIGLDFVHGPDNLDIIEKSGFPDDKILIAGVLDGRDVWRTDIEAVAEFLKRLGEHAKNIMVSNAAPLYHLPVTLELDTDMDEKLKRKLAFARERLYELELIKKRINGESVDEWYSEEDIGRNDNVRNRVSGLSESDFVRAVDYKERKKIHESIFSFPLFPTTTIGSFPQTVEVRKMRAAYRKGSISEDEYREYIRSEIRSLIEFQEGLGLDVFVHGEFERTDMVEFFAERLDGVATTKNGWIISYGTRGYRPPIIYGDVFRPKPMSVEEIAYAQSLTDKPVKGMLTGPATIIAWSYVRQDISVGQVAYQIALALKDEIADYENAGIKVVQIDEPAFREMTPIKRRKWDSYFSWAVKAFRLCHSSARPETQIHSHMCYSEFGDIINIIPQMDFDVISIEASRSRGDIIESFETANFDRQIGLGVYDVHSPEIPDVEEMKSIVYRALKVIPKENFWINPDCGLKTRRWEEVRPALKNMMEMVEALRKEMA